MMVEANRSELSGTFAALSDPTRRAIITRLSGGELALSKLAEPFDISQTAISKHVKVLSDAGLVVVKKRGRTRHCRLEAAPMKEAFEWLEFYRNFWSENLDSLSNYLKKSAGNVDDVAE